MSRPDFERYNAETARAGPGDPGQSAQRRRRQHPPARPGHGGRAALSFYAYGLGETRGWELPATHSGVLDALAAFGLPVCEHRAVASGAEG
jgi:DNA ligase (NAD+)